jgi:uncharacterized protein YukE
VAAPQVEIDPAANIPPAVRAQVARANELHSQIFSTEEAPVDGDTPPQPAPPAEAPPAATAPETPPADVTPPATPPAPDTSKTVDWERRYNAMKGRHDDLQALVRQLQAEVDTLKEANAKLRTKPEAPPVERLLTPEDEDAYGTDFLNVVGRKAKEEVLPEVKRLEQELDALKSSMQGVGSFVHQTARERFHSDLDNLAPGWRDLNNDDEFLDWLELQDAYSGATRKELLSSANARNDSHRVAKFFKGFLAERAAVGPAGIEPHQQEAPAKVPLENLAAPGRARTAAAPGAPAEKPIFTRAQITQFYQDVTTGKYRGREADQKQLEAAIHAAGLEGRIR